MRDALALQRTAGNAAVTVWVQRESADIAPLDPTIVSATEALATAHANAADHPELVMRVIRGIRDKAIAITEEQRASPPADPARLEVAHRLAALLATEATTFPALTQVVADIDQRVAALGKAVAASPGATFSWTSLITAGGHAAAAPATVGPANQAQLNAIVARRAGLPKGPTLTWIDEPRRGYVGWKYAGQVATPPRPATGRIHKLAMREFGLGEGGVGAVVTYDRTLSLGAGFATEASPQWMRAWLDADPAGEALLVGAGFWITHDNQFAAINDAGTILVGWPAKMYLTGNPSHGDKTAGNPALLSFVASVIEAPASAPQAAQAQVDWVRKREVDAISSGLRTEMETTWPDEAIASGLHLVHWLPAGGLVAHPGLYIGTNGDALAVGKAFVKTLAANYPVDVKRNSTGPGPLIIGANGQTSGVVSHYYAAFGTAVPGKAGYLKRGVDASARRFTMSVNQTLADATLAGRVIYVADAYDGDPSVPIGLLDVGS